MSIIDKITGMIAPDLCVACGVEGSVLCSVCFLAAGTPPTPRCVGCKVLSSGSKTCHACRAWLPIVAVYVANEYEGVYEQLVRSYKFEVKRRAAVPLASMMQAVIPPAHEGIIICPLPTAPARVRQRGFDHTYLLANQLGKARKNAVVWKGLRRQSNTRQLGASRSKRMKQMQSEFYVNEPWEVANKVILLVDDVVTTGASLAAAAAALKSAGAKHVYAVVFAQKV